MENKKRQTIACLFHYENPMLDRFLLRLSLGYPDQNEERTILRRFRTADPLSGLQSVLSAEQVVALGEMCREVYVHQALEDYILALVAATRQSEALSLGASPRGSLALYHTSQALAALRGRSYVLPDDVQRLAEPVLAHRLILSAKVRLRGGNVREILKQIVSAVPVPVEENWSQGEAA